MANKKRITGFRPNEVSFVKKGANRKQRYLTKNEGVSMNMEELAEAIKKSELDLDVVEQEVKKNFEGVDIEAGAYTALVQATALLQIAKTGLPEGTYLSVDKDGTHASIHKAEEIETLKSEHAKEVEVLKAELEEVKKSIEPAPKEVELSKEAQEAILQKEEEIALLKAEVEKNRDEKLTLEFITKAEKELPRLGQADLVGKTLKNIAKSVAKEDYESLEQILKSVHTVLTTSADITKELGTSEKPDTSSNEEKLQKMASEYSKTNGVTIEQARVHIRKTHPELSTNKE